MRKVVVLSIAMGVFLLAVCAAGGPLVRLKYGSFDPLVSLPGVPADLQSAPTPGVSSYYLVQFTGPIEQPWKDDLASHGAEILDYIPDYAFIIRATPEAAEAIQGMDHVRWVGSFHPAYRFSPDLPNSTGITKKVSIRLFPGRGRAAVEAEVTRVGRVIREDISAADGDNLEAEIPAQELKRIARREEVSWIEPRLDRKLCNDVARGLMNAPVVWSGIGLYGAGEIVAVCDTGLDTGNLSTLSADFAGRVLATYTLGRKNRWDDPDAHGTHVAGSVLGNGVLSGSNPTTHTYTNSFAGTAPEAQLVFQSVISSSGSLSGIPSDLNQLFLPPYNNGARVHTNSWGAAYNGVYTTDARNLDLFTWNHPDMTILMAAGNEAKDANSNGVIDLDSIDSPGTAKNCITVGGTENYRLTIGVQSTYGQNWPSDYPVDPIFSDKVSNNSNGMMAFSSRGPCDDGRIKPDICAPGTNIISTRSHDTGAGVLWGAYNSDYLFCGGTSMSTPLTAGSAALVRQFYRTQKSILPSAALIKATLINGAKDVSPGQYGTGSFLEVPARPNNVEGWGLVDLSYSLNPTGIREVHFVDSSTGLSTNGTQTYTYTITGSTDPARFTLVWTDYPAATSASVALVNDLDLTVTLPNGTVRYGNGAADRRNNVEGVDVASPSSGTYTVTVSGYNVAIGPQKFALVVSGDMGVPPPTAVITSPPTGTTLFGAVAIKGTASGTNFQQYTLDYGIGSLPSTWIAIGSTHTSPVTSGLLDTWDTSALANGVYTVRLSVRNTGGVTSTAQSTVNVLKTRLADIKGNTDGTSVTLTDQVVSASPVEFGSVMYVQEVDRSSGIKVNRGTVVTDAVIGSLVTVSGTIGLTNGERIINSPTITTTGSVTSVSPLGIGNRWVGGDAFGSHTPGVTGGVGLNNICLLIRTWGRVTALGSDYFYVDDGQALTDGSGNTGIKVYTGGLTKPGLNQYAVVTGISSSEVSGSTTRRLIRPRMQTDLVYY